MSVFQRRLILLLVVLSTFVVFRLCSRGKPEIASNGDVLCSFEEVKPWGISPEKGFSLRKSKKNVTQGKYSLEVIYPKGGLPSINTRKLINNWGEYEYFSFDVYNSQKELVNFSVRLDNANGKRVNIARKLFPGHNSIRISRSEIANKIDPSNIAFVVLFLNKPSMRCKLYFDNMRLERSDLIAGIDRVSPFELQEIHLGQNNAITVRKAVKIPEVPVQKKGSLEKIPIVKLKKVVGNEPLVSTGVPFALGQLIDTRDLAFFDNRGQEISIATKVLARWPQDYSIRSVLVQFKYPIEHVYEYVSMKWGYRRTTSVEDIIEPLWDYPEGFILMPAKWLCDSQVIGSQVPMGQMISPEYDDRIAKNYPKIKESPLTGKLSDDGYYSTPHCFYQFYVRSGALNYFLAARKELMYYREDQIVHDGKDKGRGVAGKEPRYIYMQAMLDDYLFTGDPRTLEVATDMVSFLEKNYQPKNAFYKKTRTNFWTERLQAFPFLGYMTYYEITGQKKYLELSQKYMENLYKTQMQWPSRGGFIHNLYAHDPEEGARPDEYGGSPFMTGLLLEAIIKYHIFTQSDIAADSIFRSLDWLINEGLDGSGTAIKYMTSDKRRDSDGVPDLNLLVVHALGYGYKLSGYKDKRYLDVGMKLFKKGVKSGYIGKRKHFNQAHRSSGHFLAYIMGGINNVPGSNDGLMSPNVAGNKNILLNESFDNSPGSFEKVAGSLLSVSDENVYLNGKSLLISRKGIPILEAAKIEFGGWNIDDFPSLRFSYFIPVGFDAGIRVKTGLGDWICLGGTKGFSCEGAVVVQKFDLIADGKWHELSVDVNALVKSVLPLMNRLSVFQILLGGKSSNEMFIDDFRVGVK